MKRYILILVICVLAAKAADCVAIRPWPTRAIPGVQKMWGESSAFWKNGTVLNVGWIGGTTRQRAEAWKRFQQLDALTGLTFVQTSGETQIRCSFDPNGGHWSYIGRGVLSIPANKPTMNIALQAGIFGDSTAEWNRVALHEICHAVGLSHELQRPNYEIPWRVGAVLEYYKRTQGWSESQIRYQVLNASQSKLFKGTAFDPTSIMCYSVSPSLVTNPAFAVKENSKLSPLDVSFLHEVYPDSNLEQSSLIPSRQATHK